MTSTGDDREALERRLRAAARRRAKAVDRLTEVTDELRALVVQAVAAGTSEAAAARLAQVDRMTIRSWLGK